MTASFLGIARRGFTRISWFEGRARLALERDAEGCRAVPLSLDLEWL